MILSQRFSSFDIDHHKKILAEFKKHPNSCNDVWLSTLYGYAPKENHKEVADKLLTIAKMYRENGISVSLQISNTLGHGQYMCAKDCSGLVFDGSPAEKIVGPDGTVSEYSFCPRGAYVRKYLLETLEYYIPLKPDCLWVDDDFRLLNHAPVQYGCFCDNCIAEFNARYGASFTRESLTEEILHGDKLWRERYLTFQREAMHDLMLAIMDCFHKGSPDTIGGLQHAVPGGFIMGDHKFAFDAIKEVTGKAPFSRPGGGAYIDFDPNAFIIKGIEVCLQNAALPEYVTEIYPEIENLPHCVFGKTPAGTAVETSYYFICGATNMSYSMMQGVEPMEWYGTILELFSNQRGYWDRLADVNRYTRATGLRYYYSKNDWKKDLAENESWNELHAYKHFHTSDLLRDAIPISYDRNEESVILLHPEEARGLCAEDIEHLLSKNVITDGESIAALAAKGLDLGISATRIAELDALVLYEKYTGHAYNGGEEKFKSSFFARGKKDCYYLTDNTGKAEVLGYYTTDVEKAPFTNDKNAPYGIAELSITTPAGGKWVILGYQPWKANIPKVRRDRLLNIADSIAEKPLAARMVSAHQALLNPRCDKNGNTACVSVVNCTIGKCEGGELLIRRPAGTRFVFVSQYLPETELEAVKTDDGYTVKLPTLDAWTAGTVFIQ